MRKIKIKKTFLTKKRFVPKMGFNLFYCLSARQNRRDFASFDI